MKRALLFIFSIIILGFTSCLQEGPLIMTPVEKLQGEWYYHKAFFISNNGIGRDNVLSDFVDSRVIFDGNAVIMENLRTGQILEGTYELYTDDVGGYWDEDGYYVEDMERFLTAYVYDIRTNRRFVYDWQINLLTRGKLHFGEYFSGGNYSFKMRKIE